MLAASYSPERTQQMQGLMQFLQVPEIAQTLDRISYGEPITTGRGMTTALRPEAKSTLGALLGLVPMGRAAEPVAMAAGRAGERVAERVVPQVMERGGLPAEMLGAMAQGSRSRIIPPDVARDIDMPINLPQTPEFQRAVANEPNAQVTQEGLLMNLMRQQKPEQAGGQSVRTGVFYLPEGQAKNMRFYKNKPGDANTSYGGTQAISGQTLLKNPLFVKGATGGKAPEAAFDAVMGKGSMKQLDKDVMAVVTNKNWMGKQDPQAFTENVQQLLRKYNADPSMASEIIRNSRQGNQLRYALQENIIASTVRNAGHDAVLGYGKGRGDKGEFFSEVFDVRESIYPTPEGDFDLMPLLQSLGR
jgi:hypothetical protein